MKKVLVLTTIVALAAILSVPASAAYITNWTDGFEGYNLGSLNGQGPWVNAGGASTADMVVQDTTVLSGSKAGAQVPLVAQSKADLTSLNGIGQTYRNGYAKFWVYDPGTALGNEDCRVGIFSSGNPAPGGDNVSEIFSAQVQYNNVSDNWEAQWSWSAVMMDGVQAPTSTGYTFTAGQPAPRVHEAWSYILITWAYNYPNAMDKSVGSATIKWYVNQMSTLPNLTLNIDNTTTRWPGTKDIVGVCIGSLYGNTQPGAYDNIEFHANPVPEPGSLLVLGTGLVGLAGLIRRRK